MEMDGMTPNWTVNNEKYSIYTIILNPRGSIEVQILVCFTLGLIVSEIQVHWKSEMHWMTQTELEYLTVKIFYVHYIYLPQRPKVCSI